MSMYRCCVPVVGADTCCWCCLASSAKDRALAQQHAHLSTQRAAAVVQTARGTRRRWRTCHPMAVSEVSTSSATNAAISTRDGSQVGAARATGSLRGRGAARSGGESRDAYEALRSFACDALSRKMLPLLCIVLMARTASRRLSRGQRATLA